MASSDSTGTSNLTKLKGSENYPFWRTQMQFYLDEHSCWEITAGIEQCPIISAQQTATSTTAVRDWKIRNARAARVIMTATSTEIGDNLTNFTDAASMWMYLKRYEGSGLAQRMDVYIAWKDIQFTGKNLQLFTEKYQKALRRLDTYCMTLGHELRVYDLINRVAPFYSKWADTKRESLRSITRSATSSLDDALPSMDDLVKDLLLHDQDAEMKRQDK
jgi:hypothetical protein